MCPEKIISSGTVEGIFMGAACGDDLCGGRIKLDNGEEFSFLGDDEKIIQALGKEGNRVAITYDLRQFWGEYYADCTRTEVFKAGKILSASPQSGTEKTTQPAADYTFYEKLAVSELQKKSEQGDLKAQGELAVKLYEQAQWGNDFQKAYALAEKPASQGIASGQYILAKAYAQGPPLKDRDIGKAFSLLTHAADSGYAKAQLALGLAYYGRPFEKVHKFVQADSQKALHYLQKAADKGLGSEELTYLSKMKQINDVIPGILSSLEKQVNDSEVPILKQLNNECIKSIESSYGKPDLDGSWLKKCVEKNVHLIKNPEEASDSLKLFLAQAGILKAQAEYIKSHPGDCTTSWIVGPAEAGITLGEYLYGYYLYKGICFKRDGQKAKAWLKKASEKNFKDASRIVAAIEQDEQNAAIIAVREREKYELHNGLVKEHLSESVDILKRSYLRSYPKERHYTTVGRALNSHFKNGEYKIISKQESDDIRIIFSGTAQYGPRGAQTKSFFEFYFMGVFVPHDAPKELLFESFGVTINGKVIDGVELSKLMNDIFLSD
jgi:TPR repeat protein